MNQRVKAKANAMEDADVSWISLVTRPATRIPFRAFKSEDSQETGLMIHLSNMFKRDGNKSVPQSCALAGVVLQKEHVEHFEPQLVALGLKIDDKIEQDDIVIYRQCEYADDDVVAVKLNELGGLFLNVEKGFDPFPEGTDFDENFSQGGFIPGMHVATDILMETVRNVLRTAEDAPAARSSLETVLTAYQTHILNFVDELPQVAFKLDAMNLDGFSTGEGDGGEQQPTNGKPVDKSDAGGSAAAEGSASEAGTGEGDTEAAAKAKADAEGGELTDEQKLKAAGVHLEGMPSGAGEGDTSQKADNQASAGEGNEPKPTEKSDTSEKDALAAIVAKMSEVLEAVSGVRKDVEQLNTKQDELAGQVKDAAAKAEAATIAVKGSVPSNSDAGDQIPDESLGTHQRHQQKADTDETGVDWRGTSLDRIVGEFGGSR